MRPRAVGSGQSARGQGRTRPAGGCWIFRGQPIYKGRNLDSAALGDDLSPVHRGVRGLQVTHGERVVRFAPSQMIAENLSFERALGRAAGALQLDGQTLVDEAQLATFEAVQMVIEPSRPRTVFEGPSRGCPSGSTMSRSTGCFQRFPSSRLRMTGVAFATTSNNTSSPSSQRRIGKQIPC